MYYKGGMPKPPQGLGPTFKPEMSQWNLGLKHNKKLCEGKQFYFVWTNCIKCSQLVHHRL